MGFGDSRKPPAAAVKSDIKYINCQVCELLAKNAYRQVKAARDALKPGKKLAEMDIIEWIEKISDPAKDEGEWVAKVDLVEKGDTLKVVEMEELGDCGTECKTVQRAAVDIIGDSDTDIAEALWKGKMNRAQFTNWLCHDLTSACKQKAPKLPKDRPAGPAFKVLDAQEAQLQKMMASMKESGMGGQIYDRESAMRKYMGGNGDEDEYDEDDMPPMDFGSQQAAPQRKEEGAGPREGVQDTLTKVADVAQAAMDKTKEGLGKAQESLASAWSSVSSGANGLLSKWGKGADEQQAQDSTGTEL
ncbi:hypothetical protein WJX72_011115 [[Myrmecia] bisecta]|uniref:Uncharacterized protein n=1 Tax=[Myrmecia] bisecta TaxID=41462 RepID=A0AAW1PBF2_9CHLO